MAPRVLDVALSLTIEGKRYDVTVEDPGRSVRLEWVGHNCPVAPGAPRGRSYMVECLGDGYDPRHTCAGGLVCECPDFEHRHMGTESVGCKHVRAALQCGLLEPAEWPMEPWEQDDNDRACAAESRWEAETGR